MTLHKVAAHARISANGPLKIYSGASSQGTEVGETEGFRGDADGEAGRGEGHDGEADAVDGDAVAFMTV